MVFRILLFYNHFVGLNIFFILMDKHMDLGKYVCSKCGYIVDGESDFCEKCGSMQK